MKYTLTILLFSLFAFTSDKGNYYTQMHKLREISKMQKIQEWNTHYKEKDDYEVENPASMNSGEIRRTSTVPFRQEGSMRKMSRKRSAMDEHDRIKRALEDSGFLLE